MNHNKEKKKSLRSERPQEELKEALSEYERENPGKFEFAINDSGHVLINMFHLEDIEDWQEVVIPDFVWGFVEKDRFYGKSSESGRPISATKGNVPKKLKISGGEGLRSISNMFKVSNHKQITHLDFSNLTVHNVTTAKDMLWPEENLVDIIGLEKWDVSHFSDMSGMFSNCKQLRSIGNVSSWVTANVKNFSNMFSRCLNLQKVPGVGDWNVSKGENFFAMFFDCSNLNDIGDLSGWEVKNAINFHHIFCGCRKLCHIGDLSDWNVENVKNFNGMFADCQELNNIGDLSRWNVSNGQSIARMFYLCKNLRTIGQLYNWNITNLDINSLPNNDCEGIFAGSGINFNDSRMILRKWCEKNSSWAQYFKKSFYPIMYPDKKVTTKLNIEDFMPDLRLHHEILTLPKSEISKEMSP